VVTAATRLAAMVLLLGSLLPWAGLIPGGERDPGYAARLADWALGFALCATVGALAWFISRRRSGRPVVSSVEHPATGRSEWRFVVALCGAALVLYALIARMVFSGAPLLIDELVQVLQARDLAAGHLTHPLPTPPEAFLILNEVAAGDRAFGQYPVGGPAMLVPGVLVTMPWLVGPVLGALCVLLFWVLLGHSDPLGSRGWRRGATALFAVAPFGAFMFGSHMNHVSVLLWLLVAIVALAEATRDGARPGWGAAVGAALGLAAAIRPLDAVAFALPAGVWLAWRARRGGLALLTLVVAGLGVAVPLALLGWANIRTTGDAVRFGYDALWGPGHGLGFHAAPWGAIHTPMRGLELVSLYLTRLNTYLFETPYPALLVPATGLWLTRAIRPLDRYLLLCAALVILGYWAYWHDGFHLGPRFLFPLLPVLVLWSARAVPLLRDRLGAGTARWRGARAFLAAGIVYALVTVTVVRTPTYRNWAPSMRLDPAHEASAAGVRDALVLVQESWGAQLLVRLWGLGVSHPEAEHLYLRVDACALELTIGEVERSGLRGEDAAARIRPLVRDSLRLVPRPGAADASERLLPGFAYPPLCRERIREEDAGFLLYAPWRLADDSNVYARWLPGREAQMAASFPGRPVYRVRTDGTSVGAPLVWERLAVATDTDVVSAR
jgi:hypothetical protein